jgi:hypothetical protein
MAAAGVRPVDDADRPTIIRRLYMDLTGLPPAPEAVRTFVDDRSPDAIVKVVDDLLTRPQYGERWARHWLDLVRYAETNGYERDGTKPNAWRYRDYVIDALNRDKPYDRFLIEQLPGDEIDGSDATAQIATTFLRLGTCEVLEGQSRPGEGWGKSDEQEQCRRSIYIFAKRSLAVPELELLDTPDTTGSCERRMVSTMGTQALTFLNGAFVHQQAGYFAVRLAGEAGHSVKDQVARAFTLALGRPPRADESRAALEFLDRQERQIRADAGGPNHNAVDARRKALESFCLVVLNMNEFVYNR